MYSIAVATSYQPKSDVTALLQGSFRTSCTQVGHVPIDMVRAAIEHLSNGKLSVLLLKQMEKVRGQARLSRELFGRATVTDDDTPNPSKIKSEWVAYFEARHAEKGHFLLSNEVLDADGFVDWKGGAGLLRLWPPIPAGGDACAEHRFTHVVRITDNATATIPETWVATRNCFIEKNFSVKAAILTAPADEGGSMLPVANLLTKFKLQTGGKVLEGVAALQNATDSASSHQHLVSKRSDVFDESGNVSGGACSSARRVGLMGKNKQQIAHDETKKLVIRNLRALRGSKFVASL